MNSIKFSEIGTPKQLNSIPLGAILDRITIEAQQKELFPKVVLSIGVSRTATTAPLRVYSETGIKAYSQPLKGIFRHLVQEELKEEGNWIIPEEEWIYVKETSGLLTYQECVLDSLDIFSEIFKRMLIKDYSGRELINQILIMLREKIHVVIMARDPFDTWTSWNNMQQKINTYLINENIELGNIIPERVLLDNFITAYHNIRRMRNFALFAGIPVSHYVTEANKNAEVAYSSLFQRIGINRKPKISGWTEKSLLGNSKSNVVMSPDFIIPFKAGLFDKINSSESLMFIKGKGTPINSVLKKEIIKHGLVKMYEEFRDATERDLGLQIERD